MICYRCKNKNKKDARFCRVCGNVLTEDEYSYTSSFGGYEMPNNKKSAGKAVVIAALAGTAILAFAGILVFFLLFNDATDKTVKKGSKKNKATTESVNSQLDSTVSADKAGVELTKYYLMRKIEYYNEAGICGTSTFKYDEKGQCIAEYSNYNEGIVDEATFEYDLHGNLIRHRDLYNGAYRNEQIYEYDSEDKCIKMTGIYAEDFSWEEYYEYDDRGNRIKERSVDDGQEFVTYYTYNEDNQLIASCDSTSIYYEYDSDGNLIKVISEINGVKDVTATYKYDLKGNRIEQNTSTDSYKYEYDNEGKLIRKTTYDEGYIIEDKHYTYENGLCVSISDSVNYSGAVIEYIEVDLPELPGVFTDKRPSFGLSYTYIYDENRK